MGDFRSTSRALLVGVDLKEFAVLFLVRIQSPEGTCKMAERQTGNPKSGHHLPHSLEVLAQPYEPCSTSLLMTESVSKDNNASLPWTLRAASRQLDEEVSIIIIIIIDFLYEVCTMIITLLKNLIVFTTQTI